MDDLDLGQTLRGFAAGQKVFGRYTLKRLLGRGGMGVVWLTRDEELGQEVALKFLPEVVMGDNGAVDDMRRETRRARELTHPNIVRIHDFVRDSRTAAISMEYVSGDSLANQRLELPARVFEPAELAKWVEQLCGALEYAHTMAKIVHRDLKPANLMVDARGDLKIADFGISATLSDTTTRVSKQAGSSGTPVYMSPQQMMGEKPAATDDIYSLGATLYELLTGKPPFYTGNVLLQVQNKVPPSIAARREELGVAVAGAGDPGIPQAWEETIAACLAKQAQDRPPSASEVWARLSGAAVVSSPASVPSIESTLSTQSIPPRRRSRMPLAIGLAALLTVSSGLGWYYGIEQPAQRRQAEQQRQEVIARQEAQHKAEQDRLDQERQEQERQAELKRQAELARMESARLDAEQARKAAEERAAAAEAGRVRLAAEATAKAEHERQAAAAAKAEQERLAAAQAAVDQTRRATPESERVTSVMSTSGGSGTAPNAAAGRAITIPGLNLELVPIPAGSFAMGSTNGASDENPVTQVQISRSFWLGKTEVTQAQWEAVMGDNPSHFKGADHPVECVSYDEAQEFCRKLTVQERVAGRLPSGYEYTLPTEAQWEYACRASSDANYAGVLDSLAWFDENSAGTTHAVGCKQPNAWGLHDLLGNVWEWCADWKGGYSGNGEIDPAGPTTGKYRIYRGGAWSHPAKNCRSAERVWRPPECRNRNLGFRIALAPSRSS